MAPVPIFHGRITDDGQLVLDANEATQRAAHRRSLAGRRVEVIIRKERTRRSLDQNAYLHAQPFPILAEFFGDSVEGVKYSLMGECWGWKRDRVSGHEVPVKANTSDMTVDECAFFIDWLIPWAMTKHGVDIPYPREASA